MRKPLALLLALVLGLGCVPAQAQVALGRGSFEAGISAQTPIPSGLAPAAGILAPPLAAPALAVSLLPAAYAPSPDATRFTNSKSISVSPVATAAVPSTSRITMPMETLRSLSSPDVTPHAGEAFDGVLAHSAAASVEPPVDPGPAREPARKGVLPRYMESRKKQPPLQSAFGRGVFIAAMTAAAAPVLWGAAPAMKLAYTVTVADMMTLAIIAPVFVWLWLWRKLRRAPQTAALPPPSMRKKLMIFALGAMIGLGAGAPPTVYTGPATQAVANYLDASRKPAEQQHVHWIKGGAVEAETIKILSRNPIGRETLERLRDRGGVIRLPTFFISQQQDSYAEHENLFDGVYLNAAEITDRGWTVEQFLKDPALQRRLIQEMDSTVLHELTHAVQGRRPPWTPGAFKNTFNAEQEAFLQQTLYIVAKMEADPKFLNNGHEQWMVTDAADNLDKFLKEVAAMYEKNVLETKDPYYNAYLASQQARWPAYRVHIYQVFAARATTPGMGRMYMDKAKAAAKEAGLPVPVEFSPLVAAR